ncbi:MAG: cupin domain-containing protein [Proteobacteria bacterium]|nr:cupin domain-containing protein [Pseudomonadota bacterium]MBU4471900.1 cupin domain-containing protein [Pseudomonadota bacterium]MCG2752824.1 cupin domain-containing protein [Desulfobacteraceae bacterium]
MAPINVENIYDGIPEHLPEELFQILLENRHFRIERIVSKGQGTPEGQWFDQDADEWVILLKGAAGLRFKDDEPVVKLLPGDHLHIPAHVKHRVEWTADHENTVWIAIHYAPGWTLTNKE